MRNRTGQVHGVLGGRIQRQHPHGTRTGGIAPERDSLGRRAPRKLTRAAAAARVQERQEKGEQLSQVPYPWLR